LLKLTSKVQYKTCEKGEFHEITLRGLDDTQELLLNFSWERERHLTSVELTCPSITVEHPGGTYLKVGPYFSGKYALYYLSPRKKIYFRVVNTLEEASSAIKQFFEHHGLLHEGTKYGFVFKPSTYFSTNTFEYTADRESAKAFFIGPAITAAMISVMLLVKLFDGSAASILPFATIMILFQVVMSSPLIYLYLNYRSVDKNSYLQVSKGSDFFTFGTFDSKVVYNKHNVAEIHAFGTNTNRCPWNNCKIFEIVFKDGHQVRFSSLLISSSELRTKFEGYPFKDVRVFFPKFRTASLSCFRF
jgi:hypothetical protein